MKAGTLKYTGEVIEHEFIFVRENEPWKLVFDRNNDPTSIESAALRKRQ